MPNMGDNSPLWLKLVVASVPLIAALLAGGFALTNTINRRVERLRSLIEIRKDYPGWPGILDLLIEEELRAVHRATTRIFRWYGRFRGAVNIIVIGTTVTGGLWVLHIGKSNIVGPIFVGFSFLQSLLLLISNYIEDKVLKVVESDQSKPQEAQDPPQPTDLPH
jgi:hypothetical protein